MSRTKGRKSSAVSVPSTTVSGSGTFLDRIETSLVTSSNIVSSTSSSKKKKKEKQKDDDDDDDNSNDIDYNDDELAEVIDVEEQMKLNRKKQKKREKLQKSKNKHAVVDPRLFPSYYEEKEKDDDDSADDEDNNGDDVDDDELSMDDFDDDDDNEGLTSKNSTGHIDRSNQRLMSVIQGRKLVELSVLPLPLPTTTTTRNSNRNRNRNRNDHKKRLSDAQRKGILHDIQPDKDTITFASPRRLLEIESGRAILVTAAINSNTTTTTSTTKNGPGTSSSTMIVAAATATSAPITPAEVTTITRNGPSLSKKIASGDVRDFEAASTECGIAGGAWRGFLRWRMMWSIDDVNALSLGRQMQLSIPFLTGYEAYLVGQIIEVLDGMAPSSSSTEDVSSRKRKRQRRRKNKDETNYILKIAFKNRNVSRIIVQNVGSRWDFLWHWFNQICRSRWYDAWGQIPIIGFTRFPVTENFPATRNHVLASTFRIFLGSDNWFTRVLTQNRQGLITDDPNKNIAQNLAAESNGFEGTCKIILPRFLQHYL